LCAVEPPGACSLRICTLQGRVRILHKGPGFRVAGTCLRALARPLAREGRARGFSKRGNRGQPVGENDRKGGLCGYDAGKKIKGRKRFAVVDTLGLPIVVQIQAASVQESDGAPPAIAEAWRRAPRLKHIWGDSGFSGRCIEKVFCETGITLEIVKRPGEGDARRWVPEGVSPVSSPVGFKVLPRRWVVERTFAWLGRYRRHAKDYETKPESSLAWIHIALVRLLVQRFGGAA
jgi:transposase